MRSTYFTTHEETIAPRFDVAEHNGQVEGIPSSPGLREILAEFSPLPREAVFLGIAEDGLPVLLNLADSLPGPLLICGDAASGKTSLIKNMARSTDYIHSPAEVSYIVITERPAEWDTSPETNNLIALQTAADPSTPDLLRSLTDWAHNNKGQQQSILLMIDDLSALVKAGPEVEQSLRWLLLRGPSRRVWPVVSITPTQAAPLKDWLDFFRTRLFGRMEQDDLLGSGPQSFLRNSTGRVQFMMKEGSQWLGFWIPETGNE